MTTRRQHYVWRHYLAQWANTNGLVWCLRGDSIFQTNPKNILVERDFYRIHRLTREEISVIKKLMIDQTDSPPLRALHENLLNHFVKIAETNEWLNSHPDAEEIHKSIVRNHVIEGEEPLQCSAENEFMPILELIRSQSTEILASEDQSLRLLYFLLMQYFRTKKMRDQIALAVTDMVRPERARRVANFICHFAAINVAGTLYRDRREFEIIYLKAPEGQKFISGDQPVVNILAPKDGSPPDDLVLYYPVTPELGMLLAPRNKRFQNIFRMFGSANLKELNDQIAQNAQSTLIATSREQLEHYRS